MVVDSWVLQTAVVTATTYVLYRLVRLWLWHRAQFAFFNSLPGETDFHWFWGNLHKLSHNTEERMKYTQSLLARFPRYYRLWAGPFKPVISVVHPDTVKILLKSAEPKPMGFGGFYEYGKPWLGEGLLLASGSRWSRSRRLLTPAFHFDILKPYVAVYNSCAQVLLSKIDKYAATGESFELFTNVTLCTLDIVLRCAMTYEDDIQLKGETHPYVQAVNDLSHLWFERGRNPIIAFDWIYYMTPNGRKFAEQCRLVHSLSEDIIQRRRKTLEEMDANKSQYLDFLDILLTAKDDQGKGLSELEIRNEVDTFLFEGHDTTASAISWILYSLACHPDIQKRVQEEIDTVLTGREDPQILQNDLGQLEYLNMCIKEGLRLHCPVPFIQRQLTKEVNFEDGVTLPADTCVTIHLVHLHHHPEIWEDPWEFKPDRFLPGGRGDTDTYSFVPFSAGPRNCIGQHFALNEEKVVLARILQRFTLEVDPNHKVQRKIAAVMRAENGIKVTARLREAKTS